MWLCILFLSVGSVLAVDFEDLSEYDTYTVEGNNPYYEYFFPIQGDTIRFKVSSNMSASISLTTGPHHSNPMYEILLGMNESNFAGIRLNQNEKTQTLKDIGLGLTPSYYFGFWIKLLYEKNKKSKNYDGWNKDLSQVNITIGHEGQVEPFLAHFSVTAFDIKFFGIASLKSKAKWKLSDLETSSRKATPNFTKCFPLHESYIQFQVKVSKDAWIVLKESKNSNPSIEIHLGILKHFLSPDDNYSQCIIKRNYKNNSTKELATTYTLKGLKYNEYRGFWIQLARVENETHSHITTASIRVGRMNEEKTVMVWSDPDPFTVKYYCFATPETEENGKWLIEEIHKLPVYNGLKYAETPNRPNFYYERFFKLNGRKKIRLAIRSDQIVGIAFSSIPINSSANYVIHIHPNASRDYLEKSYDVYDFDNPIHRKTIEKTEYHNFWVEYNFKKPSAVQLSARYENEEKPFKSISYKDMGFEIKYFSVATLGQNGSGFWIIEDPQINEDDRIIEKKVETGVDKSNATNYNFFRIYSNVISFKVRSPRDAVIVLTTNKKLEKDMFEIVLGCWDCVNGPFIYGIEIRKNKKLFAKAGYAVSTIVSTEYRSFLLKINNITSSNGTALSIGLFQEGKIEPYIMWTDPNPYLINYIGVSSFNGSSAFWVVKVKEKEPKQISIDSHDFYTTGDGTVKYFQLRDQSVRFKVHCQTGVNITLIPKTTTTMKSKLPPHYIQINLLGVSSDNYQIPGSFMTRNGIVKVQINSILLYKNAFADLWIRWIYKMSNGKRMMTIFLGREGEFDSLLKWTDENPINNITYVGFSSIGNKSLATWSVPLKNSSVLEFYKRSFFLAQKCNRKLDRNVLESVIC